MSTNDDNGKINRLPRLGEVIDGRYRLTETFASGGMGVIMKAEQIRTGRDVAVKLLHPHIASREDFAARFMREVKVATLFDHPHIVRVYDVGETDNGSLYLVMELLDGEELKDIIDRESPLSTSRVFDLGLQMADGLAEAHSRDVVHRDFKPSNVFVGTTRRGREVVKLLDFGIAKLVNSGETQVTATGSFTGTPSYMAPEVMVDAGETNPKAADVYAAGLVFLEMITGQRVFEGKGIAQTLLKHLKKPITIPDPIVRTPLGNVLRRATAKHPDDRYADADALYLALEKARDDSPDDIVLSAEDIPSGAAETSPSLLEKIAQQDGPTNLEMLRDVPQHAAVSHDGTPPSLPELPPEGGFGAEPTEQLGAESTDTDEEPAGDDSLNTDFSADPTEIYDPAQAHGFHRDAPRAKRPSSLPDAEQDTSEPDANFEPEPTRAERPSHLSDTEEDPPKADDDFEVGPTRAELPAHLPDPTGDDGDSSDDFEVEPTRAELPSHLPDPTGNDGDVESDEEFEAGPTRAEVPSGFPAPSSPESHTAESDPAPDRTSSSPGNRSSSFRTGADDTDTPPEISAPSRGDASSPVADSPTPSVPSPGGADLQQRLDQVGRDPKKLAAIAAATVALLILAAIPIVLIVGDDDDDPQEEDSPFASLEQPPSASTSQELPPEPSPEEKAPAAVDDSDVPPDDEQESSSEEKQEEEEPPTVSLHIDSDPSGATVWAGEQQLGTTAFDTDLTEEEWPQKLLIKKEGYEDAVIELSEYDETERVVTLEQEPEPEPPPRRRPSPSPSPSPPAEPEEEPEEDDDSSVDNVLDQHLSF